MVVSGTGTANDPFVLAADLGLGVVDNETFDLTLGGTGTEVSPWTLEVDFAPTARLNDLPDVSAPAPAAGQVLAWNAVVQQWTAQAPTTAPVGAVSHNPSLTGDGSSGAPLGVVANGSRYVTTDANGVGLTDAGINRQARHWINTSDRLTATPPPELNTLSLLDAVPGRVDYWDGDSWEPIKGSFDTLLTGTALLELSGPWTGSRLTYVIKQIADTTDSAGDFSLLGAGDLATAAGVMSLWFQETGSAAVKVVPMVAGAFVKGRAYHLTDGTAWAGLAVTGTLFAWLY
jgi:hypothetical protein